jgi:predicted ATP-grasp superfamily ATP-dependent carboligase
VPSALDAPYDFVERIAEIVAGENAQLLIPIAEPAMLALLPARSRFGNCRIPFPGLDTFRALSDKERLLAEGAALGIRVPAQVIARDAAHAMTLADSLEYPVVLKPARSVGEAGGERKKVGVSHATSADALRRAVPALSPAVFPLLMQQRIEGPGIGIFLLTWDGAVRVSFAHRRLVEKPPSGGVSVYRESVPMDEALLEQSRALLERFEWHGVAMIEYKRDARTGQAYLMEVNGRFWGSLQLAIDAGADFPRILASLSAGDAPAPPPSYKVGVRSRWWWGQVDHVIARVRRRAPVPRETVSTARAIGDLLTAPLRRSDREEVFRWADPFPFWHETLQWLHLR